MYISSVMICYCPETSLTYGSNVENGLDGTLTSHMKRVAREWISLWIFSHEIALKLSFTTKKHLEVLLKYHIHPLQTTEYDMASGQNCAYNIETKSWSARKYRYFPRKNTYYTINCSPSLSNPVYFSSAHCWFRRTWGAVAWDQAVW